MGPPLTSWACGAPHRRPRGPRDRVASYHVAAPLCASCAPCGPPVLCHVASVPRRTSRRSRAPRQPPPGLGRHVNACRYVNPSLRIFLLEIQFINQLKIRKIHKTSEIHISQNTTPFNLKFSLLDYKFLPF